MAKAKIATDEKFEKQDFDLFEALTAIDKKDYGYYDRLSDEQKKKFVPYMLIIWVSTVKGSYELQNYYLSSTNYHANKYLFNENVQKNPKLQWLMLCAASPGVGKQFHQYLPHIRDRVSKLKDSAKKQDIKEYYKKIYPNADTDIIDEISELFVFQQHKKVRISNLYPDMKLDDIEILNSIVTTEELTEYEKQLGE